MQDDKDNGNRLDSGRAGELRAARRAGWLMPALGALFAGLSVFWLARFLAEPGVERLLRFCGPLGGVLLCAARWRQAREAIRQGGAGSAAGLGGGTGLLGMLLVVGGPGLADMYRRGHMSWFYGMGVAVLAAAAGCCWMMLQESRQQRGRGGGPGAGAPGEGAATRPRASGYGVMAGAFAGTAGAFGFASALSRDRFLALCFLSGLLFAAAYYALSLAAGDDR